MSDYRYIYFDGNVIKQPWYRNLEGIHKDVLHFFWMNCNEIGMMEWDTKRFLDEWNWNGYFDSDMIDIEKFIESCNVEKERFIITEDDKLWFTPTIKFRHGDKRGKRDFAASERDLSILYALSARKISQDWFIKQVTASNEKITIKPGLLEKGIIQKGHDKQFKEFCIKIGNSLNMDVSEIIHPNEKMLKDYDYVCQYCGVACRRYDMQIDHIVPVSQGGKDKEYNKIPTCIKCNSSKKDQNVLQFLMVKGYNPTSKLLQKLLGLERKGMLKGVTNYVKQLDQQPVKNVDNPVNNTKNSTLLGTPIKNKRKMKKNTLTYQQVKDYVFNDSSLKMSDHFIVTDDIGDDGKRLWTWSNKPKKYERTGNAIG